MDKNRVITAASALVIAATALAACGKVDIQPKKDRISDSSSFSYDINDFLNLSSDTDAVTDTSSRDSLIVIPDVDDDAVTDTSSKNEKKTVTTTRKATTTTKAVTTAIPTTTTPRATTTTPRPTTTTPKPTTTTPAPTTTTTTTTTTTPTTTTTTTTTTTSNKDQIAPPVIVDEDEGFDLTDDEQIIITDDPDDGEELITPTQPDQSSLAYRAKAAINGVAAGIGDSFAMAQSAFGAENAPAMSYVDEYGMTVTEHHYDNISVEEISGEIVRFEINIGSTATTQAGLATGMTFSDMVALYGTGYSTDGMIYTYSGDDVTLSVTVVNDIVQQIVVTDDFV